MKNKTLATLLIISSIVQLSYCQSEELIPFMKDSFWGYFNQDLEVVIEPNFDQAQILYENGYSPVKYEGKWGVIDYSGSYIVEPKYDSIGRLGVRTQKGRLIEVFKNKQRIYLNYKGRRVRPKKFIFYGGCGNGIIRICFDQDASHKTFDVVFDSLGYRLLSEWYQRDSLGKVITHVDTLDVILKNVVVLNRSKILIDQTGQIAFVNRIEIHGRKDTTAHKLNFVYQDYRLLKCSGYEYLFSPYIGVKQNGKWGLLWLDPLGWEKSKIILKPKYLEVLDLRNRYLFVEYKNGRYGYVSLSGKEFWIK